MPAYVIYSKYKLKKHGWCKCRKLIILVWTHISLDLKKSYSTKTLDLVRDTERLRRN